MFLLGNADVRRVAGKLNIGGRLCPCKGEDEVLSLSVENETQKSHDVDWETHQVLVENRESLLCQWRATTAGFGLRSPLVIQ